MRNTHRSFPELVAELGTVGRVRKRDEKTGFTAADFEYFLPDRLASQVDDGCVIHPMFYRKLHAGNEKKAIHQAVQPAERRRRMPEPWRSCGRRHEHFGGCRCHA